MWRFSFFEQSGAGNRTTHLRQFGPKKLAQLAQLARPLFFLLKYYYH